MREASIAAGPALCYCGRHAGRLAVVRFGYWHSDSYNLDYRPRWYEDYPVSPRGEQPTKAELLRAMFDVGHLATPPTLHVRADEAVE
jgi:hypothetical protein